MQRNTGYFPTESLEPCGNRLFSRSALNEGYLFRGSLEKEGELKGQALARSYGRYENVFLTDTELSELQAELPEKWAYYIERLSGYIASTGKKYKNHAATIRRWAADDTAKAAPKQGIPEYTCKEGESL